MVSEGGEQERHCHQSSVTSKLCERSCQSLIFILINPTSAKQTLGIIKIIENANRVFPSIINIDMIRKIYLNVKDSPISKGFIAFMGVFIFIFLWKGSELYMQVFVFMLVHHCFCKFILA